VIPVIIHLLPLMLTVAKITNKAVRPAILIQPFGLKGPFVA